ncbi:MAG: quinone-dependent dihydroorotate dehydrogenase [Bacteriovoracaceae bacterium]
MYDLFKSLAFTLDAEVAHNLAMKTLSKFPSLSYKFIPNPEIEIHDQKYTLSCGGLDWRFPIGLAAGLDKNAEAINYFSKLLFGAIEVGTVTPMPQAGNDKPRLFRLEEEFSLRNRMGFNNKGMDIAYENISKAKRNAELLGVNLGKNKVTSQEDAAFDYCKLYEKFHQIADYLVINISSPNTPGLRDLQSRKEIERILKSLEELRAKYPKPLFLKMSPDMNEDDAKDLVRVCSDFKLSGIIATNTTVMPDRGAGGISGKLIKDRSQSMRKTILDFIKKEQMPIDVIGVGGIDSFDEILEFWKLGGKTVQIYTSFIYHGPELLSRFKSDIDEHLSSKGLNDLQELWKSLQSGF